MKYVHFWIHILDKSYKITRTPSHQCFQLSNKDFIIIFYTLRFLFGGFLEKLMIRSDSKNPKIFLTITNIFDENLLFRRLADPIEGMEIAVISQRIWQKIFVNKNGKLIISESLVKQIKDFPKVLQKELNKKLNLQSIELQMNFNCL